jgi:1,4-dihydroxy-2-naphthoate octaprenyltransferase
LKLKVVTVLLFVAMFMERYTFIVSVYKTKYFGYLLILFVILMNVMFQAIQSVIRKDKHKRMLHQMFEIERTPEIGIVIITILG